jgi:hypothetical protein
MKAPSEFDPIFVHASMRSGSTYFFNVLRRNAALMRFNEEIMDGKKDYARFKKPRTRQTAHAKRDAKWENRSAASVRSNSAPASRESAGKWSPA